MKSAILLAIADYGRDESLHLRNLAEELDAIITALKPAVDKELCEIIPIYAATPAKIVAAFLNTKVPISIFHFAGHNSGFELLLQDENTGLDGLAFADFLGKQENLQLVFLNGCATYFHARTLRDAGIPMTITTSRKIGDNTAKNFATSFYTNLGLGNNLEESFASYENQVKISGTSFRSLYFEEELEDASIQGFPWRMEYQRGAETVGDWSLPLAADDPLYGLPAPIEKFDLPESPFLYLRRYTRENQEVFFGRRQEIRLLFDKVHNQSAPPIILLYGNAGVGKSSLLDAGLLPYLEKDFNSFYTRRRRTFGLSQTLINGLLDLAENLGFYLSEKKTMLENWLDLEEKTGKPIILIIDQVEEAATRPLLDEKGQEQDPVIEANAFLKLLAEVFKNPKTRPRGKAIISYRKEFHPEIDYLFKQAKLLRGKVFIETLKREDLIEIITGLTRSEKTREYYNLSIDSNLPNIIADDLLADSDVMVIAPTIQILLTKMWETAYSRDDRAPHFDELTYQRLKEEGFLLGDFLQQGLDKIYEKFPHTEETGLILEFLSHFVTPNGTSAKFFRENVLKNYTHINIDMNELIEQMLDLYLLAYNIDDKIKLSHDTLAPLVRKAFDASNKPGQLAHRVLQTHLYTIKRRPYLSKEDLEIVSEGEQGMRKRTQKEENLVLKSREFYEKKDLTAKSESLLHQSREDLEINQPTKALYSVLVALTMNPKVKEGIQLLQEIVKKEQFLYQDEQFGTPMAKEIYRSSDDVLFANFSYDGQLIGVALEEGQGIILDVQGNVLLELMGSDEYLHSLIFSKQGDAIITTSSNNTAQIWDTTGHSSLVLIGHENDVRYADFSHNGKYIATASEDGTVIIWTRDGREKYRIVHDNDVRKVVFSKEDDMVLTACEDGLARLFNLRGDLITEYGQAQNDVLSAEFSPDQTYIIICFENPNPELWTYEGQFVRTLTGHSDNVVSAVFSPDGQHILTASEDGTAKLWNIEGECLSTMHGHEDDLAQADFSPDGRYIVTCSEDYRVLLWDLKLIDSQSLSELEEGKIDLLKKRVEDFGGGVKNFEFLGSLKK